MRINLEFDVLIMSSENLEQLGFRFGTNGTHAARTMMLDELVHLFQAVPPESPRSAYQEAIVTHNVLSKPTRKARELTYRHMVSLYGLELSNPIFRTLRRLWPLNPSAQPFLALAVALARDPLLAPTQSLILDLPVGAVLPRADMEAALAAEHPDRFSPASLKSFAQNVSGTWTAAGLLQGRNRKTRTQPAIHPESVTLMLFLGYLQGLSGQRLFTTPWMALFCTSQDQLEAMTSAAAHRGLLVFMNAGGVKEVRFPDYLTSAEQRIREAITHVV